MGWTQPICGICYQTREPGRVPVKVRDADAERCCDCGKETREGIFYRVDPATVAFPSGR